MKKFVAVILIVLALGVLGVFWYLPNYFHNAETESSVKYKNDVSVTNSLYTNSTYGFQVDNPNNYYAKDVVGDIGDNPHNVWFYKTEADYTAPGSPKYLYTVEISRNDTYSDNDFQSYVKDIQSGKLSGTQTQLFGEPALKINYPNNQYTNSGSGSFYYVLHNNYVYKLASGFHFVEADLQTLVNSFKFTK